MSKRKSNWVSGGRKDDCLTACVSKLLNIHYDEVPFYGRETNSTWLERLKIWANKKGFRMHMEWTDSISAQLPDKVIGVGKSPSGKPCDHAVIVDSQLNVIWDPEYNKKRSVKDIAYVLIFKEKDV